MNAKTLKVQLEKLLDAVEQECKSHDDLLFRVPGGKSWSLREVEDLADEIHRHRLVPLRNKDGTAKVTTLRVRNDTAA